MGTGEIVAITVLVLLALVSVSVARTTWRIVRHNEELVPGGSMGDQLFGRRNRVPAGRAVEEHGRDARPSRRPRARGPG